MKRSFKRIVCVFFSLVIALTCLGSPIESYADEEQEYYDFQLINSLSQLQSGENLYFSGDANTVAPTGVVTEIPINTAVLEIGQFHRASSTSSQHSPTNVDYFDVHVVQKGSGFDECKEGYIYIDSSNKLIYNCYRGGVPYLVGTASYKCKHRARGSADPAPASAPAPVAAPSPAPTPKPWIPPAPELPPHVHNYVWQEGTQATEDNGGELLYICPECGDVIYRVPTSAYAVFNSNSEQKIRNASANSLVTVATDRWISFHKSVMQALADRPDVSLEVKFLSEGHKGEAMSFVIPAGTDIASLLNNEDYCGFIYLYNRMYSGNVSQIQTPTAQAAVINANPVDNSETTAQQAQAAAANVSAGGQISIPRGVDSYYVAKLLEQAGLVESAASYDRFLISNGYDRRIQIGTKTIPAGADNEQIARIITAR